MLVQGPHHFHSTQYSALELHAGLAEAFVSFALLSDNFLYLVLHPPLFLPHVLPPNNAFVPSTSSHLSSRETSLQETLYKVLWKYNVFIFLNKMAIGLGDITHGKNRKCKKN